MSDIVNQPTPGPWTIHPMRAVIIPLDHLFRPLGAHEDKDIDRVRYAQEICAMHWPDRNRSEDEVAANARLIAAAPDMLAALREMLGALWELWDIRTWTPEKFEADPSVKAARAAIAKAEGRSA